MFIDKYLSFVNIVSEPAIETLHHKAIRLLKQKSEQWFPLHYRYWKYVPELFITKKDAQYSFQSAQSFSTFAVTCK